MLQISLAGLSFKLKLLGYKVLILPMKIRFSNLASVVVFILYLLIYFPFFCFNVFVYYCELYLCSGHTDKSGYSKIVTKVVFRDFKVQKDSLPNLICFKSNVVYSFIYATNVLNTSPVIKMHLNTSPAIIF